MAAPMTPEAQPWSPDAGPSSPARRRRLRAASTVRCLWLRTRWHTLATQDAEEESGLTETSVQHEERIQKNIDGFQETEMQTHMDEQKEKAQPILPPEFVESMNWVKSNFGLLSKQMAAIRQGVEEASSRARSSSLRSSPRPPSLEARWTTKEVIEAQRMALADCVRRADLDLLGSRLKRSSDQLAEALAGQRLLASQLAVTQRLHAEGTAEAQRLLHRVANLAIGAIVEFVGLHTDKLNGTVGEITEFATDTSRFVVRTDLGTKRVKPENLQRFNEDLTDTEEEAEP